MNENEYVELIDAHSRITLSGFKIGRRGFSKSVHKSMAENELEMLKRSISAFRMCCNYLIWRNKVSRGTCMKDLQESAENWAWHPPFARPEFPLGVVMLAAICVGYQVRQVRGSYDGRIVKYHR